MPVPEGVITTSEIWNTEELCGECNETCPCSKEDDGN